MLRYIVKKNYSLKENNWKINLSKFPIKLLSTCNQLKYSKLTKNIKLYSNNSLVLRCIINIVFKSIRHCLKLLIHLRDKFHVCRLPTYFVYFFTRRLDFLRMLDPSVNEIARRHKNFRLMNDILFLSLITSLDVSPWITYGRNMQKGKLMWMLEPYHQTQIFTILRFWHDS